MGLDSEHLGTQKPLARARTAGERSAGPGDGLRGGGREDEGAAASGNPCSPPCLPPPPGGGRASGRLRHGEIKRFLPVLFAFT